MERHSRKGSSPLKIQVESEGRSVEGRVVDAHADYVVGEFVKSRDVAYPIGQVVRVSLREQEKVLGTIEARVVARRSGDGKCYIRVHGTKEGSFKAFIGGNNRQQFRARPDATDPVEATLRPKGGSTSVRVALNDISISGVGVLVPIEDEKSLTETDVMEVSIRLPGQERHATIVCTVKHRSLSGSAIHYGIEFNAEHTPGFAEIEEEIRKYVILRQVDMIRKARKIVRPGDG